MRKSDLCSITSRPYIKLHLIFCYFLLGLLFSLNIFLLLRSHNFSFSYVSIVFLYSLSHSSHYTSFIFCSPDLFCYMHFLVLQTISFARMSRSSTSRSLSFYNVNLFDLPDFNRRFYSLELPVKNVLMCDKKGAIIAASNIVSKTVEMVSRWKS